MSSWNKNNDEVAIEHDAIQICWFVNIFIICYRRYTVIKHYKGKKTRDIFEFACKSPLTKQKCVFKCIGIIFFKQWSCNIQYVIEGPLKLPRKWCCFFFGISCRLLVGCIERLGSRILQSLKFKWRGRESNPGPLAPQAKSLTTRPPPLPIISSLSLLRLTFQGSIEMKPKTSDVTEEFPMHSRRRLVWD